MYRRKKSKNQKQIFPQILMLAILILVLFVWYTQRSDKQFLPFLSRAGAQTTFASEANQDIQANTAEKRAPLILQTDEKWGSTAYGSGSGENTLAANGCAIASLAMVLSYWQNQDVKPTEISNWAQNNYYIADEGSAWTIFPAFGEQYGLTCQDLGNNLTAAQSYLNQGIPVVVSVKAGDFTNDGHIMILRDWTEAGITVNDPNDTPEKKHYQQVYTPETIAGQGINYWVYTK